MANATLTRKLLRPKVWIPSVVLVLAAIGGVLYWFQPQALFIDQTVNEDAPGAGGDSMASEDDAMAEDGAMKDDAMKDGDAMMTLTGSFRSIDHETTGQTTLSKADDGHYYVRFQDFRTENGPDLVVYLSTAQSTASGTQFAQDFVDLGALKGNIGNQNYQVPDGTDLEKYKSVVIWCRRFNVAFGAAPLNAA
jgi:hypothetical protein